MSRLIYLVVLITIITTGLFSLSCAVGGDQGKLELQDDFSNPSSGWQVANLPKYSAAYSNGRYVISIKTADYLQLCNLSGMRSNCIIEVETNNTGRATDNSSSGIVFGWRDAMTYSVFFVNATEGTYFAGTHISTGWSPLINWKKSSAIKTGKEINILRLKKIGEQITVYINGTELSTVDDDSVQSGQIGLGVSSFKSAPCSYAFDNFKLYELPSSSTSTPAVVSGDSALLAGKKLKRIFEDDFTKCGGLWTYDKKTTDLKCGNGVLNMAVKSSGIQLINLAGTGEPSDFLLEVDVRKVSGDVDSSCGLDFRFEGESVYMYQISDGKFFFLKSAGGKMTWMEKWRASSYIKPDSEVNRLKVICMGKRIELYANGSRLGSYIDQSSEAGAVFLTVDPGESSTNASYSFDNFKLSSIE
jgi:hypothetical protein